MKERSGSTEGLSASELIDKRIAELVDWRGKTLSRMRKLINLPPWYVEPCTPRS